MMKKKDILSVKQTTHLMMMFILSEVLVGLCEPLKGNGTWITFIISGVFTLIIVFIYSYVMNSFPEKDIYDISRILMGNIISKIVSLAFVIYAMYVAIISLNNIVGFSNLITLNKTPIIITGFIIVSWSGYIIHSQGGIEAVARTYMILFPIILSIYFLFTFLLIPQMNFDNLLPISTEPFKDIIHTSHMTFSNTGGDFVLFMALLIDPRKKHNRLKSYTIATIVTTIIFVYNSLFITSVLGVHLYHDAKYPVLNAFSIFNYSNFISRIELLIALFLMFSIVCKISIGIYAASVGCGKTFKSKSFKKWVFPICAIVLFAATYNHSIDEYGDFNHHILWIKNIFQVGIPIIVAIVFTIKKPKLQSLGLIE